jgi:hypothetical protein
MKTANPKSKLLVLACMFLMQTVWGQSSGRVVINEYMPWTSNGCGTTSEFIELLNFGPGPANIGCYIVTTGKYSITLPPNTILQPGDYYVLAGRDFLPNGCANVDSAATGVRADLNWNTCNCTNEPVPTTGAGLMTDGGSSNTPVVLLDPSLNVIDAVVRSLPAESSTLLHTATINGHCGSKSFNLGSMPIVYEELGMSAGRGNSFARSMDGDCGWVKDPQQTANASNNRSGDETDIRYSFTLINPTDCGSLGGRASIYVEHGDYASVFPMNYTLALDKNRNGIFDEADDYTTFIDNTPPSIEMNNLAAGHYKITVSSVKGCYLKNFEFTIISCLPLLPVQLESFKYAGKTGKVHLLEWKLQGQDRLQKLFLQKAKRDGAFTDDQNVQIQSNVNEATLYSAEVVSDDHELFRLKMITKEGNTIYSPVISALLSSAADRIWPNPANDILHLELYSPVSKLTPYAIYNASGNMVGRGTFSLKKEHSVYTLPVAQLPTGFYHLQIRTENQPISFRFVKH